jgi:hypothetical protein
MYPKGDEALLHAGRAARLLAFLLRQEKTMFAVHPAGADPDTQNPDRQASLPAMAERALRSSPYPALKKLSCDSQSGVLVLRGCLPTYYLKQIAQEVVVHLMQGMGRLDNQIQVFPAVVPETPPDKVNLGVLATDEGPGEGRRDASLDPKCIGMAVKIMAPFGEEIEVDG